MHRLEAALGGEPVRGAGGRGVAAVVRLHLHDGAARALRRREQRRRGPLAVIAARHQRGEAVDALRGRVPDGAIDRLRRDRAHDEHIAARRVAVVRERDHRDMRAARGGRDRRDVVGHQRAENQFVAVGDRPLGRRGRAGTGVVVGDAQVRGVGIEQRHRRGVGDRLADRGVRARKRHQQRHPVPRDVLRQPAGTGLRRRGRHGLGPLGNHGAAAEQRKRGDDRQPAPGLHAFEHRLPLPGPVVQDFPHGHFVATRALYCRDADWQSRRHNVPCGRGVAERLRGCLRGHAGDRAAAPPPRDRPADDPL